MTATFNANLSNPVSQVRQKIGDTNVAAAQVDDATINYYLSTEGLTVLAASAQLCYDLAAKYAGMAEITVDDQLSRFSHISKQYLVMADRLNAQANAGGPSPADTSGTYANIMVTGGDYTSEEWIFGLCPPR